MFILLVKKCAKFKKFCTKEKVSACNIFGVVTFSLEELCEILGKILHRREEIVKKYELIQALIEAGAVAVIRAENKAQGLKIVEAVRAGGITAIEITMTVPHADEIIRELSEAFGADVLLGAGTVLDAETARACILAGAQYIVGPSFNEGCARFCNRYAVPYIPGVMTPQEAVRALEFGADILKLFPAELFGPKIISAFEGPLPQGIYMPTGGITVENAAEWIKAGAAVLGIGGSLTKGAKTGDFGSVTRTARQLKEVIAAARGLQL